MKHITNPRSKEYNSVMNAKRTTEYNSWRNMKSRCLNPNSTRYKNWGGRGITVCERWLKFDNFLEDMGEKPDKSYSLERIDNSKGYSPDNCKWASPVEQANNSRRWQKK